MKSYPKTSIRRLLFLFLLLSSNILHAQLVFKKPSVAKIEYNNSVTIEKVSITPTAITFELEYDGGKVWKYMRSAYYSEMISVPYLHIQGVTQFSLSDGKTPRGVAATSYQLYNGPVKLSNPPKRKTHFVQFPFNSGKFFFNLFNDRYTKVNQYLLMDFAECPQYNPKKDVHFGCFNFTGIFIPFTHPQLHVLYLQNELNNIFKKGEFETSAAYTQRTNKDSVLKKLIGKYNDLEDFFVDQKIIEFLKVKPSINYNADQQRFTIHYAGLGIDPIVIEVPLAEAQGFKNSFLDGSLKLSVYDSDFRRKNGTDYYFTHVSFTDKNYKLHRYSNLNVDNKQAEGSSKFKQEVFTLLEAQFPKGKVWADVQ